MGYDYMAYMDFMDLAVWKRRFNLITHSLTVLHKYGMKGTHFHNIFNTFNYF